MLALNLEEIGAGFAVLDRPLEGLVRGPIGVLGLLAVVHLVNIASALHAWRVRVMLGSRARRVPAVSPAPDAPPPAPDGGQPAAAQPPADSPPDLEPPAEHIEASSIAALTPRKREVLGLIASGYSNAEIAEAFVISEGTVKTHVKRLLAKLGLRDRTQAVVFA